MKIIFLKLHFIFFIIAISVIDYSISFKIEPSNGFNLWCLIWFILASLLIWQDKKFNWLFFLYLFGLSAILISCFIDEFAEIYLIEIESIAILSGATSRASCLSTIFICSTYFFVKVLQETFKFRMAVIKDFDYFDYYLFKLIFIITIFYTSLSLYLIPPPIFMGSSRFDYFHTQALPGFRFFLYTNTFFIFDNIRVLYTENPIKKNSYFVCVNNDIYCVNVRRKVLPFYGYILLYYYSIYSTWIY